MANVEAQGGSSDAVSQHVQEPTPVQKQALNDAMDEIAIVHHAIRGQDAGDAFLELLAAIE